MNVTGILGSCRNSGDCHCMSVCGLGWVSSQFAESWKST